MRNGAYKIGEVAKRAGMNPRTIRFYESEGILPPPKRTTHGYASAGHRLFTSEDLRRLKFVRQARLLGLSLEQIRELGEAVDHGCCAAAQPRLKTLIGENLAELRRRIRELRRLERRLTAIEGALADQAPTGESSCGGTIDRCLPLEGQPLLQIKPPKGRRPTRNG